MTATSTLFSEGGSDLPYISNNVNFVSRCDIHSGATSLSANRDNMWPFQPRSDVTVKELAWHRLNATAANVYVGIYDNSGNLLTDCAVDSDTTAGMHMVTTTNTELTKGAQYWFCLNQSAQVAVSAQAYVDDVGVRPDFWRFQQQMGMDFDLYSTFRSYNINDGNGHMYKTRTTAALIDPQTMSSWLQETTQRAANVGFIAV